MVFLWEPEEPWFPESKRTWTTDISRISRFIDLLSDWLIEDCRNHTAACEKWPDLTCVHPLIVTFLNVENINKQVKKHIERDSASLQEHIDLATS